MSDQPEIATDQRPVSKRKKRQRNNGLRKLCRCPRRNWPKCPDSWYMNFKSRGGKAYMLSLDREIGKHLDSKEKARAEADRIRALIREGKFVPAAERVRQAAVKLEEAPVAVTLDAFAKTFIERVSEASGKKSWKNDRNILKRLGQSLRTDGTKLGAAALTTVTEDDLEAFHAQLRKDGRAASTLNGYVQVIKQAFRWAARKGYLAKSPISEESTLKREKVAQRSRRLMPDVMDKDGKLKEPGEERRLLAVTSAALQRLIIAALETGCRRGELLSLQWADVDLASGLLRIRAEKAKDGEDRVLPISARLAAILEMAKLDPAGEKYPAKAYVFGEVGQPVKTIKKAWETAILRAHGHAPAWVRGALSPESRAALRQVDLHFHDLRHEAGSRLVEAGWPLHKVRDMLGHASIDQTDTYLNASKHGLRDEMRRMDEDRSRCKTVVIGAEIGQPLPNNGETAEQEKVTVN